MANFVLSGPDDISGIPHDSAGKLFSEIFTTFDENSIAVVDANSNETLTYKQLYQLGKNLAASLRLLGLTQEDTVGLVAENSREFVVVYVAALFLGAPLHLINPKFTEYELKHTLTLSEPAALFCTNKARENVTKVVKELNFVKICICVDLEKLLKQETSDFQIEDNINPDLHTAVICNSSGTTGLPKGVMITHEMLRLQMALGRNPDFYGLGPGKTYIAVLPFFHIYSLSGLNGSLYSGATLVILDQFKPDTFLETIQKYKPKSLFLVPILVNFLLKYPLVDNYDLTSVKQVCSGGSNLSQTESEALKHKLHLEKFQSGYGMTETGIILYTHNDLTGSVGQLLPGYQSKIVDLKTGTSLPASQIGELCIKGTIMTGYVNNLEETKKVIDSDGFLHSGDLAYYDENSYFYITGRIKDIIKYKSHQVSPSELEHILLQLDGIREVVVVGKPDPRCGELPTAFVVKETAARIGEKEICEFLAERVSREKWLHGGVRFIEDLPRNSTGKIIRYELIKLLKD